MPPATARSGGHVFVFDLGSNTCRVGIAGADAPTSVLLSAVLDDEVIKWPLPSEFYAPNVEAHAYARFPGGSVAWDFNVLGPLLNHTLEGWPVPVLATEPRAPRSGDRAQLAEMLFEATEVPAAFVVSSAALSAFAFGCESATVVDLGAAQSSVTPVHQGRPLPGNALGFAGDQLDLMLQLNLSAQGINFDKLRRAKWAAVCDTSTVRPCRQKYSFCRILQDMKETMCFCSRTPLADLAPEPPVMHTLPDGQSINVAAFSRDIPEILLNGSSDDKICSMIYHEKGNVTQVLSGVPALFSQCVQSWHSWRNHDAAREVLGTVLLVGGSSLFVNFNKRFQAALAERRDLCPVRKWKVLEASHERRYAAWLGASVLASSGILDDAWVTRREYDEFGGAALERCL